VVVHILKLLTRAKVKACKAMSPHSERQHTARDRQRWLTQTHTVHQVVFYCHFPDLLLSQRHSLLHSLYRLPLDFAEQSSTGAADCILVNSKFTRGATMQL
jgi:hypothetical protein